jgi:hypothetical protein
VENEPNQVSTSTTTVTTTTTETLTSYSTITSTETFSTTQTDTTTYTDYSTTFSTTTSTQTIPTTTTVTDTSPTTQTVTTTATFTDTDTTTSTNTQFTTVTDYTTITEGSGTVTGTITTTTTFTDTVTVPSYTTQTATAYSTVTGPPTTTTTTSTITSTTIVDTTVSSSVGPTITTVTCSPATPYVGTVVTCTATVANSGGKAKTPTGTVTFTSSSPGTFSSDVCTLSGKGAKASCEVDFTPADSGVQSITATYSGDSLHSGSSGNTGITVSKVTTSTVVSPNPAQVSASGSIVFTATVTNTISGSVQSPTKTVSWSDGGAGGTFSSATCNLSSISSDSSDCSVTYTAGSTPGTVTITASYGGSHNDAKSKGKSELTVGSVQVPITIDNEQSTATPAPFQQMIVIDSNNYNTLEASNLQNVYFEYANGSVVPSWLESGNSNTASSTVYWVNLAGGIGADSSLTIYMHFAAIATNMFNGATIGEAPQLSSVYAEYDDGANIFNFYDNFAGTTLNSHWSTASIGTVKLTVDNGLTMTGPNSVQGGIITTATFSAPQFFDVYVLNFTTSGGNPSTGIEQSLSNTYADPPSTCCGFDNGYGLTIKNVNGNIEYYNDQGVNSVVSGNVSNSFPEVVSLSWTATGSETAFSNYGTPVSASDSSIPFGSYYLSIRDGGRNFAATSTMQWARTRAVPPDNVMPSVSIGSIQGGSLRQPESDSSPLSALIAFSPQGFMALIIPAIYLVEFLRRNSLSTKLPKLPKINTGLSGSFTL